MLHFTSVVNNLTVHSIVDYYILDAGWRGEARVLKIREEIRVCGGNGDKLI